MIEKAFGRNFGNRIARAQIESWEIVSCPMRPCMNPTRCCWQIFFGHLLYIIIIWGVSTFVLTFYQTKRKVRSPNTLVYQSQLQKSPDNVKPESHKQTVCAAHNEAARIRLKHVRSLTPNVVVNLLALPEPHLVSDSDSDPQSPIPNPQSPPSSKNLACLPNPTRPGLHYRYLYMGFGFRPLIIIIL